MADTYNHFGSLEEMARHWIVAIKSQRLLIDDVFDGLEAGTIDTKKARSILKCLPSPVSDGAMKWASDEIDKIENPDEQ